MTPHEDVRNLIDPRCPKRSDLVRLVAPGHVWELFGGRAQNGYHGSQQQLAPGHQQENGAHDEHLTT
eukprot:3499126-Amphidinium_carterae.2